ncbi:MAG: tetratricopeptide repeat protein [Planctomycetia bacterium]
MSPALPDPARLLASDLEAALGSGNLVAFASAVDAHLSHHDDEGAVRALWAGLERWPQDAALARRLADALHRTGDRPGMRRFATLVHQRRLRSPDLHFALGTWAEERGERGAAARAFARAARAEPQDSEAVVRLARTCRQAQRPDLAERAVRRALEQHPKAADLHAALGYALVEAHRPVAAAAAFRDAVRLEPGWATYREDLASALMLCERWREAAVEAQAVVREQPRSERGWAVLASGLARLGQREHADKAFRRALELARQPARLHGNYGLFLCADPARLFEAARHLRTALETYPEWEEVRLALAQLGR